MDKEVQKEIEACKGFQELFKQLKNLYLASFSWKGLPITINQRYLKKQLLDHGKVCLFKDEQIGVVALNAEGTGDVDLYGENRYIQIMGDSGYNVRLNNHRCVLNVGLTNNQGVIIYNDDEHSVPLNRLRDFAQRIYNCEQTIDMNIYAQRTPVLVEVADGQELSMKAIYKKYDGYAPVIVQRKSKNNFDEQPLKAIKTDAPIVFPQIETQKRKLWNEALSYIGIENNFSEKNERLVANEVMVSNGLAISQRKARESALNEGLEIAKTFIPELSGVTIELNNISMLEVEDLEGSEVDG